MVFSFCDPVGGMGRMGWTGGMEKIDLLLSCLSCHSCPSCLFICQCGDAWKRTAAQELERRASAGGDVRDAIGEARLLDRRDRIAAADDRRAFHVRDGL